MKRQFILQSLLGMGCDEIFHILDMNNDTLGNVFKRCRFYDKDKEISMKNNKSHDEIGTGDRAILMVMSLVCIIMLFSNVSSVCLL